MHIDVQSALNDKNPKLARRIPRFVIHWIERLIHQNEMNQALDNDPSDSSLGFARYAMDFFQVKARAVNLDKVPETGRYIIVANHPLGGLDGLALISLVGYRRQDMYFPVNDLLMQLKPMHEIFIPLNKHGATTQNAVKQLNDVFASDGIVLYFPAGMCSRKQQGKIQDLEWKKTIIAKARDYQRDIIPAYVDCQNSAHFYTIANCRRKLKIKTNIEMLLLPDEAFRQKGKTVTVTFGDPIPSTFFDKSKNDKMWATWLKEKTYALNHPIQY
ncbi:MAG: 1-acyl-sn-glycerol-3-phosphate acyltransferase [Bacteroidales bacterium]|nr:1-acyl-sn-glycerol-3-phosphate acyltransferase [Bacteroidales bacterium]